MKPWERMFITLILCLTLLAAVWLHGRLNRYGVVVRASSDIGEATRYDRITGRVWVMHDEHAIKLGVERDKQGDNRKWQPEIELLYPNPA